MKTVLFYPHSINEIENFRNLIENSDFWGEWNPMSLRFEFKEENEMVGELLAELKFISREINGHFEVE